MFFPKQFVRHTAIHGGGEKAERKNATFGWKDGEWKADEADYKISAALSLKAHCTLLFACFFIIIISYCFIFYYCFAIFIFIYPDCTCHAGGPGSRLKHQTCFAQFKENSCCCEHVKVESWNIIRPTHFQTKCQKKNVILANKVIPLRDWIREQIGQ